MIVTEHVTGCLAEWPPERGVGRKENKSSRNSICWMSCPSAPSFISRKICLGEELKSNQSLYPTNLGHGSYEGDEKNETREPRKGPQTPFLIVPTPQQ